MPIPYAKLRKVYLILTGLNAIKISNKSITTLTGLNKRN
jgi:hypothetical protein